MMIKPAILALTLATFASPVLAQRGAYTPPAPGTALNLTFQSAEEFSEDSRGRDVVVATGEDFAIHRYESFAGLTDIVPDDVYYYVEFTPLAYVGCDEDMPSAEDRERAATIWPLSLGKTAGFKFQDERWTYSVIGEGKYMLAGEAHDVWIVENKLLGDTTGENTEELILLKSPSTYIDLRYGYGDREKGINITFPETAYVLSDEERNKLQNCAALLD
ncbi:MAG: hypothetical protein CMK07_07055 [Ponticaulis sp.]|nr:hypothetical protein [Ponticaulis sp.]